MPKLTPEQVARDVACFWMARGSKKRGWLN